jgi:hypothetical protein
MKLKGTAWDTQAYMGTRSLLSVHKVPAFDPVMNQLSAFQTLTYYLVKTYFNNKKVKLSLQQAVKAHGVVRRQDNWLTDGDEVFSLTRRPPFTTRKLPVLISIRG